jgi:hypothetical protein
MGNTAVAQSPGNDCGLTAVRLLLNDYERLLLTMSIGHPMRKLRLVLSALVIVCSPFTATAQVDFASSDVFLKATLEGGGRLSLEARGDLNGDGLDDWAGVIERRKTDSSSTSQLYVLLRLPQGGYRVAEKSKEEKIAGMGCCWVEDLKISRSSIYIQNNAKTAGTMEAATHQFKLHEGEWRLIGVRIFYLDVSSDASTETDMNLLTGSVIEKRQKGENKPMTKSRRKRFATHLLKDFDFFNGFGIG